MRVFATIIMSAFLLLPHVPAASAEGIQFQVRRILNEDEIKTSPPETFPYSRGPVKVDVMVAPEAILTVSDVEYATIPMKPEVWNQLPAETWKEGPEGAREIIYLKESKLDLPADPRVEFVLTSSGSKKLEEFTRKSIRSGAAVLGNNQVLSRAVILAPVTDGKVKLFHVEKNLNDLVKFLNQMGVKLLVRSTAVKEDKPSA